MHDPLVCMYSMYMYIVAMKLIPGYLFLVNGFPECLFTVKHSRILHLKPSENTQIPVRIEWPEREPWILLHHSVQLYNIS